MEISIEEHALLYGLLAKNTYMVLGGEKGKEIMAHATVRYGNRRGKRMRKHADNRHILPDVTAYFACGEWQGKNGENKSETILQNNCTVTKVSVCKWKDTWEKYQLLPYGSLYCQYIDKAIVDGFNSGLALSVEGTLSEGNSCCTFIWNQKVRPMLKDPGLILPFAFHCIELLACIRKTLCEEAPLYCEQILQTTEAEFSQYKPEEAKFIFDKNAAE